MCAVMRIGKQCVIPRFKIGYKAVLMILLYLSFNIESAAQTLDSLSKVLILSKIKNKQLYIRVVPLQASTWRSLNPSTLLIQDGNNIKSVPLAIHTKEDWSEIIKIEPGLGSYQLNFASDQELINELPKDDNGKTYDYTPEEIENLRYIFNFFACNTTMPIAIKNGLGYIEANNPPRGNSILKLIDAKLDTIEANFIVKESFQKPPKPTYNLSEHQIIFEWPALPFFYQYYAFDLEKSYDGKKYNLINESPITNFYTGEKKFGFRSYFSFQDTLNEGATVYYRLKGIDYFGDKSIPGDPVVINIPGKIIPPLITKSTFEKGGVTLTWDFLKKYESDITSFSIYTSDSVNGEKKKLVWASIQKSARSIFIPNFTPQTAFVFIECIGANAPGTFSFPYMMVAYDSIAPAMPFTPTGLMNEKGEVNLLWRENSEKDILGYRVFRSVDSIAEYSQITIEPIKGNQFKDTIYLNTLSKNVYYKIAAVDNNYNQSELSPTAIVGIYDTVPPSSPSFYFYLPGENQVTLKWYNSESPDVKFTHLYRRTMDNPVDWQLIKATSASNPVDSIIDPNLIGGKMYEYNLIAEDMAGNRSKMSRTMAAKPLYSVFLPPITDFQVLYESDKKQININWKYSESGIIEYWIYKQKNNEPLTLFSQMAATENMYIDYSVEGGNTYTYMIKAVHSSGRESKKSSLQTVKIEK